MLFYLTVAALLVASANANFYSDCGSKLSVVESVSVSGCAETARECILRRNTNATITIVFTPSKDLSSIDSVVHGVVMNLPVPFPLPQPDACIDNGLQCPIKSGTKQTYHTTLPILKSYPKVAVGIKWELTENEEDIVCVMIRSQIH